MSGPPDISNQEKLVSELIRIDSDDSDGNNNDLAMSNADLSIVDAPSCISSISKGFDSWMRDNNTEYGRPMVKPTLNDLNPYAMDL